MVPGIEFDAIDLYYAFFPPIAAVYRGDIRPGDALAAHTVAFVVKLERKARDCVQVAADRNSRKKRKQGTKVPLSMNIDLYNDEDHETKQVRQLHERIQRLDLIDRALVMMWLEGMNYDEIADVVGISVKNVGVKLVRIKEKLKQK